MTERQTPLSDDELLSAYLDGELAGDDLARVERLLAEQPASRQLLAELRALGDALRALPRGQLGAGFPERVLRKAERQLLTESQVSDPRPVDREPARWRNKRPWIYACTALAAGLLVAIVSLPHPSVKQPANAGSARSSSEAEGLAADKLARHEPAATRDAIYPPAMAASKPAAGEKHVKRLAISPATPESSIALKTALAQWGVATVDADEIVQQLHASEWPSTAAQPLNVWSLSVDADALEHDRLGRVLTQNRVHVLEQRPLNREATAAASAASDRPPAANTSTSHVPVRVVLVAGSPDQLKATLADLRSQSDTFQRLTDLGRKSLQADANAPVPQQIAPGLQAKLPADGGKDRNRQAVAEKLPARRGALKAEAQSPTEWALFILRRAEPIPAKQEPPPTKPEQDEE